MHTHKQNLLDQLTSAQLEKAKILNQEVVPWDKLKPIGLSEEQCLEIAKLLISSLKPSKEDKIVFIFTPVSKGIAEHCLELLQASGAHYALDYYEPALLTKFFLNTNKLQVQNFAEQQLKNYEQINKKLILNMEEEDSIVPNELRRYYDDLMSTHRARVRSGEIFYTLTSIPTIANAALEEIKYEDYLQLYYKMCTQPWEEIGKAQQILIEHFNQASTIRLRNSDGTDLTMSIKGQTFANSLIAKNLPGSEFFSSPIRDSVNGKLVAKGKFMYDYGELMEDLEFEFKDGKIINFSAARGQETLNSIVTLDDDQGEGSRHVGEIGFGTNPALNFHVANGLLVEKIASSFHIALGSCYTYDNYLGTPVKLDNGNFSKGGLHWDITTMLLGKNGTIELDGTLVHSNGHWLIPGTSILDVKQ